MNAEELAARSTAVVVGSVIQIETAADHASGGVNSYVHIEPYWIVLGALPEGEIVLRQPGGDLGGKSEWVLGSPEFSVGEEVLVFLDRHADGALRTTGMAMGKYRIEPDGPLLAVVRREFGVGTAVFDPSTGDFFTEPEPETHDLESFVTDLQALSETDNRGVNARTRKHTVQLVPSELDSVPVRLQRDEFTYLSTPSRWFEPDSGEGIAFRIDASGDAKIGPVASRTAVNDAFSAWSSGSSSSLLLVDGGVTEPMTFSGCGGGNRIIFNDPFDEITDPIFCGGVLAIGGFCTSAETRELNGTTFRRIRVGKVTFNNGWSDCFGWNECNMAEVATHELGHTIGLGHSPDRRATMYGGAHFDGRCASLEEDDSAAVSFVYPAGPAPSPTYTATGFEEPTATVTPTHTPNPTRTSTPSPTATRTRTGTHTRAPTHTAFPTATPTPPPTATRTPTLTVTPTDFPNPTRTSTPPPTATRTRTATHTRAPTHTAFPTATPTPPPTATRTPTFPRAPTHTHTPTPTRAHTSLPTQTPPVLLNVNGRIEYYKTGRGVPGATVRLRGSTEKYTETAPDGQYSFAGVAPGTWELEPEKVYDFGSGVSALDASYILQSLLGLRDLDDLQQLACDATGNGSLSTLDAARILQFSVGKLERLPVAEACGSDWAFVPVPEPIAKHASVNPEVSTETCEYGRILLEALDGAADNQDFHALLFGDCTGNWQTSDGQAPVASSTTRVPRVRLGRLRRIRDNKVRLRLFVRTVSFHALEARLRYDPSQLAPVGVRARRSAGEPLVHFDTSEPGIIHLAVASGQPMRRRQGLFQMDFAVRGTHRSLHPVEALHISVDERPAEVIVPRRNRTGR